MRVCEAGAVAIALVVAVRPACAAQPVTLVLNWVAGAEHGPFYFAQQQGWYARERIELKIESVLGSPQAVQQSVSGTSTFAVADFVAFARERARGADVRAVMVLQPTSPWAFYFMAESGIASLRDFPGKRLAAQPQDPMRRLWPVLAQNAGVDPAGVQWVELNNASKPEALAHREIDVALNPFLHNHLAYRAALGERLRVLWWRDAGFPAYGHVLVAAGATLRREPDLLRRFVRVTQRAFASCLASAQPCIDALRKHRPELDAGDQRTLFALIAELNRAASATTGPLGAFDLQRAASTLQLLRATYGISLEPSDLVSNDFVDPRIESVR